jgi:hypothetical protein
VALLSMPCTRNTLVNSATSRLPYIAPVRGFVAAVR